MKKIILLLLALLMLISFSACDYLFRDTPPQDSESSASPTPESEPPVNTQPDAGSDAVASPSPSENLPEVSPAPTPGSTLPESRELTVYTSQGSVTTDAVPYSAALSGQNINFKLFYNNELYQAEFSNNAHLFFPVSENSSAFDYMEISFINGAEAEKLLPSFVDSYIDFTDIEFSSYNHIGEISHRAESIVAYNSEQYLNAYLIDLSDGVMTIVMSSTSHHSDNFAWFNAMLSTISIE